MEGLHQGRSTSRWLGLFQSRKLPPLRRSKHTPFQNWKSGIFLCFEKNLDADCLCFPAVAEVERCDRPFHPEYLSESGGVKMNMVRFDEEYDEKSDEYDSYDEKITMIEMMKTMMKIMPMAHLTSSIT